MILSLSLCGAIAAHPGHGTPIEEPSDPGTGDDTNTDSGSTGSSSADSQTSTTSGYTSSGYYYSSSSNGESQSDQTGAVDTPTTDNTATQTGNAPEEVFQGSGSGNSAGGPVAMIGLMVFVGLIAMSFPYKEGGTLSKLQMSIFG